MCAGYSAECMFKDCKALADCRFDPFCKDHRAYMYDNEDQGAGRSKYAAGEVGSSDVTSKYEDD